MANRNFPASRLFGFHLMPVSLDMSVSIGASGAPTIEPGSGLGIASISRMAQGQYRIQLEDNYAKLLKVNASMQSPVAGPAVAGGSFVSGSVYQIVSLGSTTQAQWVAAGLPPGITAVVGVVFKASAVGAGSGTASLLGMSGISSIELMGNSINMLNNQPFNAMLGGFVDLQTIGLSSSDSSPPPGSPDLASSFGYGILAKSAITTTNPSSVNGDFGISPNGPSSVTGAFNVSGERHEGDSAAAAAQVDANAAYVALAANGGYVTIPNALDSQNLSAGYYTFGAGDVNLAQSGAGTLTLNGSASDIFVFKTPSTLTTGAGGMPTIALTGGALASNVYWVIGSSATINVGVSSAGAEFQGSILAAVSITVTQSGTVNGRLIATTASGAAITLSDRATVNASSEPGSASMEVMDPADGSKMFLQILLNNSKVQ